ncbi:ectoine/hydroxyectoine ABC transporter substrate-binding protein EhuB [Paenibacillus sp. L3-i20]|uniref:ectoine/hydroxyectoine ABC transporter substrate-binding protein EhuB n=1 Tax=Paenibacillus sp. L3-i20 TaxID=2905833 RepID=UPI001EDF95A3|nr:ectoine/hydroxyectoine ABC transporter substrate-binding protein EhuB [Paenibacillus sp. L3-i20]GKU79093.1 ectoine/hydroxyectoine ABC transporter substrate-binding protein EhuB [Paenibacillus sp. L3-i20]
MIKVMYSGLCLMLLGLLVGCGNGGTPADSSETTLAKAQREGYITVGFANERPYAYATPDGKLTGEAVEISRKILSNLGIKQMDGVLTEFGSLIPGLKADRYSMITAGMFITKERAKQVAFANPEYSIGEALAVKKGNPLNLKSYEDIKANPKAKIAVMVGAIELEYLKSVGIPETQIISVPDQPAAISALQSNRVDALTMTGPSLQSMLESAKDDNLERVMDFTQPIIDGVSVRGYGAAVFRIGDDEFREAFNAELNKLKQSGELLEILKQFGFTEQELPGDVTAEELIK